MLHPQARMLLDMVAASGLPATHTLPPVEARRMYRDRRAYTQPEAPPARVRDLGCPGPEGEVPLRLFRPQSVAEDAVLPVMVYFHGGGWVIGDLDTHDVLCRQLANAAGIAVVSVDYRMGPEHRFPGAVDDCLAATYWVRRNAATLKVDAARLAVGGDSAGGNLAAVVALLARDAGDLPVVYQLLIYPATDMRRGQPSHTTNGQGYLLTSDTMQYFHDHYIDDVQHDIDPRASPLLASDHARLPPALVLTAGFDPLRDEGMEYATKLTAAGSQAMYVCFERQIHGFITMGRVLDEASTAVALCAAELRRALNA
ncbi:MAG: alpha/beta hydrolase [Burkholderiales bacterium]